jgi:hypothetical protein
MASDLDSVWWGRANTGVSLYEQGCRIVHTSVVALGKKEVYHMFRKPSSPTYHLAVSFKWLVGLIFILGALYALFVNHLDLVEASILFGIGVILV